ncbi:hypothetical protein O988_06947 [Pseudogymnoascus sp. VKM F-3808]|nr:hypothetical protein O988_06947 [Pseudogymnoascus sp. VKM F-3808]
MPPDRTRKSNEARKTAERKVLARRTEIEVVEMLPCTHCQTHGRKCVVSPDEGKSRCSECVWRGIKCDVEGIPVRDWAALEREEERIRSARQAAVELMAITSARLARLEKQQEFLRKRGLEMLRRGLLTLDELDTVEEAERLASVSTVVSSAPTDELPEFDVFGGLSPSFWNRPALGAVDGTPPISHD